MGPFSCFQRRSTTVGDKDPFDRPATKGGRRTRSNSPATSASDDGIVGNRKAIPLSPMGQTGMLRFASSDAESSYHAQLSRITEEPTVFSSSTARETPRKQPKMVLPPPAREAAFHGPPRFDWMDIETTAATKIQSIYRRNKVMNQIEKQGYSTSAIRNRKRRRKAKRGKPVASADVPSFLSCCAVGLAFGEATEDDDQAYRDYQKRQYEERVKQQQMHEDALRKRYLRTHGAEVGNVVERIEVIQ